MAKTTTVSPAHGRTLAIGFGSAVAMWAVAYVAMMNPGLVLGEALFVITLGCIFLGGAIAGRHTRAGEAGWLAGLKVGLTVGLLNLLLIGSLTDGDTPHEKYASLAIWAAGNLAISIVLAAIGGATGERFSRISISRPARAEEQALLACHKCAYNLTGLARSGNCPECGESIIASIGVTQRSSWFNLFTIVAAATVFLLLITGGLVTGLEAGLAVPDWPNSFGHNMLLYPLSEMIGGVYYEHAHRLYGMLVGVTAITLVVASFALDERGWLRGLAIAYLLMVIGQGIMGGTRVTETSRVLAIAHGVFGQAVFATIASIAAFTSPLWLRTSPAAEASERPSRLPVVLVTLLIVQLALGAMYRHLRREWNNPPEPVHVVYTHIIVAILVTILAIMVGGKAWSRGKQEGGNMINPIDSVLSRLGLTMLAIVGGQLLLGTAALIAVWSRNMDAPVPTIELVVTTAHQATGALLLACAALVMWWERLRTCDEPAGNEPDHVRF